MTTTAQGTVMLCDHAGCRKPGTVAKDAWSFCTDHAGTDAHGRAPAPPRVVPPAATPRAAPMPSRADAPPTAAAPAEPPAQPLGGGIGQLLENASGHSNARVRRLGDKVEAHIDQLRALIAELAADEKRKQDAIRAKAEAKAEVERLQRQLAEARAKLRPKKASNATDGVITASEPCTSCGGPKTRAAGTGGRWSKQCQSCGDKSA